MKIGLVPFNPTIGNIELNLHKTLHFIDLAIQKKCQLVVFPELSLIGYPPKDYLFYKTLIEQQNKSLAKLKRKSKKIAIIVGTIGVNKDKGNPFKNQALIIQNGQIEHYTKQLLPNYDVFDEQRYFEAGSKPCLVKIAGKKVAISICEDIWYYDKKLQSRYHHNPIQTYKKLKPDLLINISASPFELDKIERRKSSLKKVSQLMGCPLIYVNQMGGNDDLVFDGGALVANDTGKITFQTELFDEQLFIYDSDLNNTKIQTKKENPYKLLEQALITGTRDYCHKTGFHSVVIGLSGGIDSALVTYLASKALGPENVLAVMMPSRYSSKGSVADSKKLIQLTGVKNHKIAINPVHKAFEKILRQLYRKKVNDITAQNIQSRIRGVILMAISNNTNCLLLNTSNKSELALGYGTLYGDMCGAIGVIADLTKTQIYELCRYINRDQIQIPNEIINKAPSAELRPNQKDTDSLPPYEKLDPFLEEFIYQFSVQQKHLGQSESSSNLVKKVLQNEYKRYQAPPGLKVTGKAFGSGRRIPIASKLKF
ncbi:hypothetical protein BVY03_01100 [bacterium K02(2017)]|nr:hypothetical protein BVY03_01100 [bacterium K02(2017)]